MAKTGRTMVENCILIVGGLLLGVWVILKVLVEFGLLFCCCCCCCVIVMLMCWWCWILRGEMGPFIDKSRPLNGEAFVRAMMLFQEYLSNDLKKGQYLMFEVKAEDSIFCSCLEFRRLPLTFNPFESWDRNVLANLRDWGYCETDILMVDKRDQVLIIIDCVESSRACT